MSFEYKYDATAGSKESDPKYIVTNHGSEICACWSETGAQMIISALSLYDRNIREVADGIVEASNIEHVWKNDTASLSRGMKEEVIEEIRRKLLQ